MDTRLLEDALVLLEERSLSAAAARRNVTQPAFSRRIRALEDWIGRDLLVRGPNKVEIAPALAGCEAQIRAMLAHLGQLRSQLQTTEGGEPLAFAAPHSLSYTIFPELYERYARAHPGSGVRLRTSNQEVGLSQFLRAEADILIAYEVRGRARVPFDDSIARHVWRRDALIPVVGGSLRHRLTHAQLLPDDCPVIRYPETSPFGQIVAEHEIDADLPVAGQIAVETAFSIGVGRLVLRGLGAAWLPHSILHDEIVAGDAVILSHRYGRIPLDISLFVHRANARASAFVQSLN